MAGADGQSDSPHEATELNLGFIYILRNEAQPEGLLKIGRSNRDPSERADEISSGSGVLGRFEVLYFEWVPDSARAERLAHDRLKEYRVQRNREFFDVPLGRATEILHAIAEEERRRSPLCSSCDVSRQVNASLTTCQELQASRNLAEARAERLRRELREGQSEAAERVATAEARQRRLQGKVSHLRRRIRRRALARSSRVLREFRDEMKSMTQPATQFYHRLMPQAFDRKLIQWLLLVPGGLLLWGWVVLRWPYVALAVVLAYVLLAAVGVLSRAGRRPLGR